MNLNLPLSLYYETCDEGGMVDPYFTGDITDSEGRTICRADSEGKALDLIGGFDDLTANIEALLTRHNALVEAMAWERECRYVRNVMRLWHLWPAQYEAQTSYLAARAEVDRLIANESASDCKGEE